MDVSHNRNYHLFTNQKCRYLFNEIKIKTEQIMQLSGTKFLVPSETIEDKLYRVDMETGLCECFQGFLKGPCKHKAAVAKKYKVKNFDVLPQENEKIRSFYYFLGTGINRNESWFRPLVDETYFTGVIIRISKIQTYLIQKILMMMNQLLFLLKVILLLTATVIYFQ